ncbi:MAG: OB-fold putative lipoprotein [Methylobacillus sp.]|jgi:hypothetical protein|nr:OB-fold putative lipoprotein [Methylobacillus sp.]
MKLTAFAITLLTAVLITGCSPSNKPADQARSDKVPAPIPAAVVDISPQELKFVQTLLFDDIVSSAQGIDAVIDKDMALQILGISQSVDAKTLAQDYADNEVAADQKYKIKGSYIMVSGVVDSISKDFKGDPYVSLRGHQMLQGVQARFPDGDLSALAALKKGQKILFVCTMSSYVIGNVMLRNCATLESYAKNSRAPLDQYVADVFAGKKKTTTKEAAQTMALLAILSQRLPANSACFTISDPANDSNCEKQFDDTAKSMANDQTAKDAMEEIVKKISL